MPQQLFVFIQLEFAWALGPTDGRYLLRRDADGDPERVVVLSTLQAGRQPLGAPTAPRSRPSLLARVLRGQARSTPTGPEPAPVPTARATVIDPISLSADNQARTWLAELDREHEVAAATAIVNRVIHSHRIAAADPYVHEVSPAQALVIRAGWGEGEQVADGRWLHARALTSADGWAASRSSSGPPRGRRRDRSWALRPQERLAALLAGRGTALLCEELVLRARQDLDRERTAHAAFELDRAYALAVPELRAESRQDLAIRIAELEQLRAGVQEQAQAALELTGRAADEDALTHALERLEAALRARTAAGL
ncbi:MAG TPA: hypothetical protein VK790_11355 [Solirubrobacteraceae bacterium]|jgi:hypothetical protein|nr:hypothetical protein [Solirubrobacteraceae bacterium]